LLQLDKYLKKLNFKNITPDRDSIWCNHINSHWIKDNIHIYRRRHSNKIFVSIINNNIKNIYHINGENKIFEILKLKNDLQKIINNCEVKNEKIKINE
jgi:hypothetical protein